MKLYVVYFRTMQDSPEVKIVSLTTSKKKADEKFAEAKKWEEEWMADEDEESGNWAEACITTTVVSDDIGPGSEMYIGIKTTWIEDVKTTVNVFGSMFWAKKWLGFQKRGIILKDNGARPFYGDETLEESMHLRNPEFMSDYYFSIEPRIVE